MRGGDTGDRACDSYHRFEEDVALLTELGARAYRFSIAWPRIQPDGTGAANPDGVAYYRRLVEALRANGIEPVATLYHWDLPQALQDRGGWPSREVALRFADYAELVARELGDSIRWWITLNEPWVAAWLGYGSGVHAPGHEDDREALAASHHQLLAHGLAAQALRAAGAERVGISLSLYPVRPASGDPGDAAAAARVDDHMNRLFLDPLFGRGYPAALLERYGSRFDTDFMPGDDLGPIAAPLDFLGVNYYSTQTISSRPVEGAPEVPGSLDAWPVIGADTEVTAMGWPVEPEGLTATLRRVHRYGVPSILVTENGAAYDDVVGPDGTVGDAQRISYLDRHLRAAADAVAAGVPLHGYFVWSLLDNFEWAEGYSKRFGIVHVDFATGTRTPKASFGWYRERIAAARAAVAEAR